MAMSASARAAVVLVATILGVALTGNLGAWQLRRAAQKIALQTALESRAQTPVLNAQALADNEADAASQHYRPVHLRGTWLPDHNVYLENRQMGDRVGFYLVTPLRLDGRPETVLVQRGWVPRDQRDRTLLPTVPNVAGLVEVEGHVAPPPSRLYEFSGAASGVIRQNIDLRSFASETGLHLLPLSIRQDDSASTRGDGLMRQWPRPAIGVETHYGYAFQWFALATLMTGLYVWFQLVRPRIRRNARA